MYLSLTESMQIPPRGATQPLVLRWGFETTSKIRSRHQKIEGAIASCFYFLQSLKAI